MNKPVINEDILTIIKNSGKKSNLYSIYFLVTFLLFGSLGAFDIATNFIGEATSISYFNLTIGIFFSLVALISLIFLIYSILKPKQLVEIDFKSQSIKVYKTSKKVRTLPFTDIYFVKTNDNSLIGFLFKYARLHIYLHNGERIKLNYLNDSRVLKRALESMLGISEKNTYQRKSIKLFFHRCYHYILKVGFMFIHHKEAKILSSYDEISNELSNRNIKKILLVSSPTINKNELDRKLKHSLKSKNIDYIEFVDIETNPTILNSEEGKKVYVTNNAEAIIAIGGGSTIDCAKGIAILVNTKKNLKKYKGIFKVHHKVPLLIAIPTTCGTGSETSFVTVIKDNETNEKFSITSNKIVPSFTLLDASLIKDLPLHFVGSTAFDAFTHALESYLNLTRDRKSKKYSLEAMKLIRENLSKVKEDPANLTYKANLLKASYLAGNAFSRGIVGPIHALSHALGSKYNLGHGYTCTILLPRFLNVYLFSCYKDLANIARHIGIKTNGNDHDDAKNLITYITLLIKEFNYKQELDMLKKEDISSLASKAYKESHLLYPSKHFVTKEMYEDILISLLNNR